MRPVLKPGLRRLWRDSTTLQIGVDPLRAVILTEVDTDHLSALDTLEPPGPDLDAGGNARDPATRTMIELLAQVGLLDDDSDTEAESAVRGTIASTVTLGHRNPDHHNPGHRAGGAGAVRATGATGAHADEDDEHGRLGPDIAALSLSSFGVRLPRSALSRRRLARVCVRGAGRVGAQIATLLTAAGVGQVIVDDPGDTSAADVAPGGLRLADIGQPRSHATQAAMRRVGGRRDPPGPRPRLPGARSAPLEPVRPDLVLLAPVGLPLVHPDECLGLERSGIPHLLAGVRETTGVVGPLVIPGTTACLHCQHLHRDALDPDWPILAMQMIRRPDRGPDPCEISLATLVAAIASMQALDLLDLSPPAGQPPVVASDGPRPRLPVTADGTLEISRADLRVRRRTWPHHPECPCRTARTAAGGASPDPPPGAMPSSQPDAHPSPIRSNVATGSTR